MGLVMVGGGSCRGEVEWAIVGWVMVWWVGGVDVSWWGGNSHHNHINSLILDIGTIKLGFTLGVSFR